MPATLETTLDELERLHDIRKQCRRWRDEARAALIDYASTPPKYGGRWDTQLDTYDAATVVKALCFRGVDEGVLRNAAQHFQTLVPADVLGTGRPSPLFEDESGALTYAEAARALTALSSSPRGAFRANTMCFYYTTVRELYFATQPEWVIGGARSGPGGRPTAVSTSSFVRAILSFARTLERTARYASVIADFSFPPDSINSSWREVETRRRLLALRSTLALHSWNLALDIEGDIVPSSYEKQTLHDFVKEIPRQIVYAIDRAVAEFKVAIGEVKEFRIEEEKQAVTRALMRRVRASEDAHGIAADALQDALRRAEGARALFPRAADIPRAGDLTRQLGQMDNMFRAAATAVKRLLRPTDPYLSSVLDRQMARSDFEPAEVATAAAALGCLRDSWDDERFAAAATHLVDAVTDQGFLPGKPYHVVGATFFLPDQSSILSAFSVLLQHVPAVDISSIAASRIRTYFANTRQELAPKVAAWRWIHGRSARLSPVWTAGATLALDRVARMLDQQINAGALRYLQHRTIRSPRLDDLFYPDYGLDGINGSRKETIAIRLEQMRAHITDVVAEGVTRVRAVVLHGPPGTGKTTLIEALAASAHAVLVEVTPSDIAVQGPDAMEARAHAVLRALALLTRAVILFDEFDPVLRRRATGDEQTTMFTLLTAGMLPKLKNLYESATEQHVAYALNTNFVAELDRAAIRGGRFDDLIGVYPPDIVSRLGRLQMETLHEDIPRKRIATVVMNTADAPMHILGRPGWFTQPRDKAEPGTIFHYLRNHKIQAPPALESEVPKWTTGYTPSAEEVADLKLLDSTNRDTKTSHGAAKEAWREINEMLGSNIPSPNADRRRKSRSTNRARK